jgi:hypothetical protein
MNEEQANEVLRVLAEHCLTRMEFLYGQHHVRASEVVKEALIVSRAAKDAKRKE